MEQEKEQKKVNIFSEPETIDAVIKSRLAQFSTKGGSQKNSSVKWTEPEIELRNAVILDYLTTNCLSREQTARQIADRWDVTMATARKYVREAITTFCDNAVEESDEVVKKMFEEKLQGILQDAIDAKDRQSSLRALEIYAKAKGFYREKSDINLTAEGNIRFDFGDGE